MTTLTKKPYIAEWQCSYLFQGKKFLWTDSIWPESTAGQQMKLQTLNRLQCRKQAVTHVASENSFVMTAQLIYKADQWMTTTARQTYLIREKLSQTYQGSQ